MSSCSQVRPKLANIYTGKWRLYVSTVILNLVLEGYFELTVFFVSGSQRAILLFLLFESVILVVLAGLVRFCCIFWSKKKLQGQNLGTFLEKRVSFKSLY